MHKLPIWRLALACLLVIVFAPILVFAADGITQDVAPLVVERPTLSLPWGAWLIEVSQIASAVLVPILGAFLLALLRRVAAKAGQFAAPLQQILTNALIDRMVRLAVDYALAAVEGAARGKTVDVHVAPTVIALGAQRAVDTTLPWVVAKAGGAEGIAERIFRSLDLDEAANANNVLAPAVAALVTPNARPVPPSFQPRPR